MIPDGFLKEFLFFWEGVYGCLVRHVQAQLFLLFPAVVSMKGFLCQKRKSGRAVVGLKWPLKGKRGFARKHFMLGKYRAGLTICFG